MALPWISRFVFGTISSYVDWTMRLPARPWSRSTVTIGGARTSAAGIPASHVVRRDYLLNLTLRYYETERGNLEALIAWGQSAETLLWYPDAALSSSHEVYLEAPQAGQPLDELRSDAYPSVLESTITLRRYLAAPWSLDFFPET